MNPRRSLAALVLVALAATGCGAGAGTETDRERSTPFVANVSTGSVAVRAVRVVVADSASVGASPSASPSASASPTTVPQAYLLASFVNRADTADTLTSATVAGSQVEPVNASSTGGGATGTVSLSLPPHQVVQVGTPDAGFTGTALGVGALPTPLVPGETTTVTFTFQTAGTVTVDVPIMTTSDIGTTASAYPVTATG